MRKAGTAPSARPAAGDAALGTAGREEGREVGAEGGAEVTAAQVLKQFRMVFTAVKTHFQQTERSAGIGGAQVWALSIIRDQPGIGVNELAQSLNVRQPTASGLLKSLSTHGYVLAKREGPDRRAVQLYATAAGEAVLSRTPGPFAGVLPQALASVDPEVLSQLAEDLDTLIGLLGADESAAEIPLAHL